MQELKRIIEEQRKGHENEPLWMVGQQLMDMAERETTVLELLKQDLTVSGMELKDAKGALDSYANKHHGKSRCFCISPMLAEKILREFYKLPDREEVEKVAEPMSESASEPEKKTAFGGLNLADFL